jgi:uncharacterized protein YeaO (DUF488 family)
MIQLKRAYDEPSASDGMRILVDRLWPRGISKEKARIDEWMRDIAPSTELRKWFGHNPSKWPEFKKRYKEELMSEHRDLLSALRKESKGKTVTLVYAAKDRERNNALALKEILGG